MSTIQELWFGNIKPNEDKVITDEEKRLVELMARHQEQLSSSLKTNELDSFNKYVEYSVEYASLIEAQAFEIGFRLAIDLLTEQEADLNQVSSFSYHSIKYLSYLGIG